MAFAYTHLGKYVELLAGIGRHSHTYAEEISTYLRRHGRPTEGFPPWTVSADDIGDGSAARDIEASLAQALREAQQNPDCAAAWAKWSSTPVNAAGFATLADAVEGMGKALLTALDSLPAAIATAAGAESGATTQAPTASPGVAPAVPTPENRTSTAAPDTEDKVPIPVAAPPITDNHKQTARQDDPAVVSKALDPRVAARAGVWYNKEWQEALVSGVSWSVYAAPFAIILSPLAQMILGGPWGGIFAAGVITASVTAGAIAGYRDVSHTLARNPL